jgi:hypothetical protein
MPNDGGLVAAVTTKRVISSEELPSSFRSESAAGNALLADYVTTLYWNITVTLLHIEMASFQL